MIIHANYKSYIVELIEKNKIQKNPKLTSKNEMKPYLYVYLKVLFDILKYQSLLSFIIRTTIMIHFFF